MSEVNATGGFGDSGCGTNACTLSPPVLEISQWPVCLGPDQGSAATRDSGLLDFPVPSASAGWASDTSGREWRERNATVKGTIRVSSAHKRTSPVRQAQERPFDRLKANEKTSGS